MVENVGYADDNGSESGGIEPQWQESSRGRETESNISEAPDGGSSAWLLLSGSFFLVFSIRFVQGHRTTTQTMTDPKSCQNRSLLNSFGAYQAYYSTAFLGVIIRPIFDRG